MSDETQNDMSSEELHKKLFKTPEVSNKEICQNEYWLAQPFIGEIVQTSTTGSDNF